MDFSAHPPITHHTEEAACMEEVCMEEACMEEDTEWAVVCTAEGCMAWEEWEECMDKEEICRIDLS